MQNPLTHFHTPSPTLPPRETAPMLPEERARAQACAESERFNWIAVLVAPLCFGPILPFLAYIVGLLLYRTLFDARLDIDHILETTYVWLVLATALFTTAWVLLNIRHARRDDTKRYWRGLPARGEVELERHTLVTATNLWSNAYDPDCNTLTIWNGERLEDAYDSGITQWLLATTTDGHLLVLKKHFPGTFTYAREAKQPAPGKHLHPLAQLAIAFAPRTNLTLGQRFEGAPLSVRNTGYWLSNDELERLTDAAHHWAFAPPDRYGVVNGQEAAWLQQLVDKAASA